MGKFTALLLVFLLSLSPVFVEIVWATPPQRVARDSNGWLPWATMGICPLVPGAVTTKQELVNLTRSGLLMPKLLERFSQSQAEEIRTAMTNGEMEEKVMPAGTRLAFMLSGCQPLDMVRTTKDFPSWYVRLSDDTEVYVPKGCTNFSAVHRGIMPPAPAESEPALTPEQPTTPAIVPTLSFPPFPPINISNTNTATAPTPNLFDRYEVKKSNGGNGKWWALGIIVTAAAIACIVKCPRGGGVRVGGDTNNFYLNNSNTTPLSSNNPPPTPPPAGPIGGPAGTSNGTGQVGTTTPTANTGGSGTTGPTGPSTLTGCTRPPCD